MIESTAAAVGEVADDAGVRGPQRHRRLPLELVGERSTWVNVTAPRRNSLSCKPRRRRRRVAGVPPEEDPAAPVGDEPDRGVQLRGRPQLGLAFRQRVADLGTVVNPQLEDPVNYPWAVPGQREV